MTDQPEPWRAKVAALLSAAVSSLSIDDYAERQSSCAATGEHGVRAHVEGAVVRFVWGGRDLLLVDRRVFDDDADLADTRVEFILDVPDYLPDGWADDDLGEP